MQNKKKILLLIFLIVVIFVSVYIFTKPKSATAPISELPDMVLESEIEGNKEDLVFFSIAPNQEVSGMISYRGTIKGGYFFEANILINVLDANKKVVKHDNAVAKTDWMTSGPVDFGGNIDFSNLPKGLAYFEIHNDNASGLLENDKFIRIPIIIK